MADRLQHCEARQLLIPSEETDHGLVIALDISESITGGGSVGHAVALVIPFEPFSLLEKRIAQPMVPQAGSGTKHPSLLYS